MQLNRYIRLLSASLLLFALSMSAVAQRQSSKAPPKAASQPKPNLIPLSLEEATAKAMVFGQDGMLYILNEQGGRYNMGTLYKLDPQAFSRLIFDKKKNRYYAQPDDLTEVYVFGREEPSTSFNPNSIIAGADGKLYISGHWQSCARYDPAKQSVEWVRMTLGSCFAATADGLLWCRESGEGSPGKVFHTRGAGNDLGGILGTEQWKYASLASDGYLYGATDDALMRVKTDGGDITVLHAFTGKNDHPVGAPILIGTTLFGCAHDESKISGEHLQSGYIYKLNADGTGYATVVKLDYDPEKLPFIAHGNTLYGLAPAGLFTLSLNERTPKIITPAKEQTYRAAMAIDDNAAYLLWAGNQIDVVVYRVPIAESAPVAASSRPSQETRGEKRGPALSPADAAAGVATSNPAPAVSAPTPGGKSVFHKRQATDDSQTADAAPAGSSSNAADEGMSSKPRAGLPPRQSKPPTQVSSSVAPTTRDAAPPTADEAAGVAMSNAASPASAAPVPGGKSVFHKRQNSGDTQGASPGAEGVSEGTSATAADEGMPAKTRPGLPPRQSRTPAEGPSPSADSENSFSSADQESTRWGSSSPSAQQPSSFGGRNPEGKVVGRSRSERESSSSVGGSSAGNSDASGIAERVVQAFSDGDVETLGALYADTVDYYDSGRISSDAVRSQLQEYFVRWPVRQWTITTPVKVKSLGASVQQVTFSATYEVSNPQTGRHVNGTAKETLMLAADPSGAMKIISHHEQTANNASREKSSKNRDRRERIYDARPVIPWPPNIPLPPIPHP